MNNLDWDTLFGPVTTGVQGVITDLLPLGIGVLVTLAGVSIGISLLRKFGVRR